VLARLSDEVSADDGDDYLTATIYEVMRRRPVLPNVGPRLVMKPIEVGGWAYPTGVCLVPNAYLVHHDPDTYSEPYAFRPERFLDKPPSTYTWIPYGGGVRRCLGAAFAEMEMRVALEEVLRHRTVHAAATRAERVARRNVTFSPAGGTRVIAAPR
jgi:cytochrome P450